MDKPKKDPSIKELVKEFEQQKAELQPHNRILEREEFERQEQEILAGVNPVLAEVLRRQAYTSCNGYSANSKILHQLKNLVRDFWHVNELLNSKQQSQVSDDNGLDNEAIEKAKTEAIQKSASQLDALRTLLIAKGMLPYLTPPLEPMIVTAIVLIAQFYGLDYAAEYVREHKKLT